MLCWRLPCPTGNSRLWSCARYLLLSALCLLLWVSSPQQSEVRNSKSAIRTPPPQPIPFSHKQHAGEKPDCGVCHETAESGERAGLPSTEVCMACHQQVKKQSPSIRRLAEYHANKERLPWMRIYQLPDFVFFSHATHLRAKATCETCHGPVQTRDVLRKEKEISMAACIECHRAHKASIACSLCHEIL